MNLTDIENIYIKFENCSNIEEVYENWKEADLSDDCLMFVVGNEENVDLVEGISQILSSRIVCDYFQSNKIQLVNNRIIKDLELRGVSRVLIDYSLMFDSNICTYINAVMERKSLEHNKELIPLLLDILHQQVRYDFTFYLYENSYQVIEKIENINDSHELWDSLNTEFQKNIINLIKFKHIKPEDANSFKTSISESDAVKEAMVLCYKFYIQANDLLKNIRTKFKMMKLTVLKIIEFQFESHKSHQNKFLELTKFMSEEYCFMDRESIIAVEYFKDKNLKIFKGIYPRMDLSVFLKKIENISWDLMAPRLMEDFIKGMSSENQVFIPFFVSYDRNLRETIASHPVKYIFLNGDSDKRHIVSIPANNIHQYFFENNCHKAIREIHFNTSRRRENMADFLPNLDSLIASSYQKCIKALNLQS